MVEVRRRWGDEETAAEKIQKRRLEWLGHLTRMPCQRIPKSALFGLAAPEMPQVQSKEKMEGCDQEGLEGYRSERG